MPLPERDRPGLALLLADDEERGHLLELPVPDLGAELLVPFVDRHPEARGPELRRDGAGVVEELVGDRDDARLLGREPEREVAPRVLDEDPEKALERAEDRPMEDHGPLLGAVLGRVLEVEPFRVREVDLERPELPGAADRVGDLEVELRAVERAVSRVDLVGPPAPLERRGERLLGEVPVLEGPHELLGAGREGDLHVGEAERAVDLVDEVDEAVHLRRHLLERHEQVTVVLTEGPDAGQPLGHPGPLVAVEPPEVGVAHRQVAVGESLLREHQEVARAVHRLHAVLPLVRHREEHVLVVVLVVPRALEELHVVDLRGHDLRVPVLRVEAPHVVDEEGVDGRPLREEERRGRRPRVEEVEPQLLAELAVVAGPGLLHPLEVLVQLLLGEERGAVDPLEHRVPLVALPVGAGGVRQLEDAELPGGGDVRAAAEVDEVGLPIAGERALGDAGDDLHLQVVALLLEDLHRLGLRHLQPLDRGVLRHDLPHLGLDLLEVLLCERPARVEVVVVAVLDGRPDPDLHAREEALHGVGGQVGGGVTVDLERVGVLRGDHLERPRLGDRSLQVEDLPGDLDRERVLREAGADGGRHRLARRARSHLPDGTVGKGQADDVFGVGGHGGDLLHLVVAGFRDRILGGGGSGMVGASGLEPLTPSV